MKRTFTLVLTGIAAAALFGGLVHAVLVAANVSEPAGTTVYGLTPRRFWATAAVGLALVGVVFGGLSLRPFDDRLGTKGCRPRTLCIRFGGGSRFIGSEDRRVDHCGIYGRGDGLRLEAQNGIAHLDHIMRHQVNLLDLAIIDQRAPG